MQNLKLRTRIFQNGVTYRAIAEAIGVSPQWLSVLMSRPLTQEQSQKIEDAVTKLSKEVAQ